MKRKIRLSESDLHRVIKESVKKILREVNRVPDKNYSWKDKEGEEMDLANIILSTKKAAKYARMAGAYDENGNLDTDKGAVMYFNKMVDFDKLYWDMDVVPKGEVDVISVVREPNMEIADGGAIKIVYLPDKGCYALAKEQGRPLTGSEYYDLRDKNMDKMWDVIRDKRANGKPLNSDEYYEYNYGDYWREALGKNEPLRRKPNLDYTQYSDDDFSSFGESGDFYDYYGSGNSIKGGPKKPYLNHSDYYDFEDAFDDDDMFKED